jgi:hypothetical protein
MLGQVTKLMDPGQRSELTARLHAWWEGRDYVPADPEAAPAEGAETAPAAAKAPEPVSVAPSSEPLKAARADPAPPAATVAKDAAAPKSRRNRNADDTKNPGAQGLTPRIRALETLWGEGRFGPGSGALDSLLLDEAFGGDDANGALGLVGADAALVRACRDRSSRALLVSDWREGCADRTRALSPGVEVAIGEPDRPRGLPPGELGVLISIDAFAFSDHKAGLVARAYKALSATGRWVIVDTTRSTPRTPAEAFASAWAEPQVGAADDIEDALRAAGFHTVRRLAVADLVLDAARQGYVRLAGSLGPAVTDGQDGREGAAYLHELAWEAASWRARSRAIEGGALAVDLWIAEKSGEPLDVTPQAKAAPPAKQAPTRARPVEPVADAAPAPTPKVEPAAEEASPLDQSSIDSLFD